MTNLETTSGNAPHAGGGRARFRAVLKGTLAAAVVALAVAFFASPASAHALTVSGAPSCATSTYTITWTITNDFAELETATVNSVTGGLGTLSGTSVVIPNGTVANPTSKTITQTLPASATGTVSMSVTGVWPNPNPYTSTVIGNTTLPLGCFPPGLSVTKSIVSPASPVTVAAGSATNVVYGLAIKNTGALATAGTVTVNDPVPAHTTYVAGSATCLSGPSPVCTATESAGVVTFTLASGLKAGNTYSVSFAVTVDSNAPAGTIPNTATYTGPGCFPQEDSDFCSTNTVIITVVITPVISVVKSANATTVTAGQPTPVTYTLTATNTSTVPTNKATVITDVVPSELTYVAGSASCGSTPSCTAAFDSSTQTVTFTIASGIAAGASDSVTFEGTVNTTATNSISNTGGYTGNCTPAAGATTCQTNTVIITLTPPTKAQTPPPVLPLPTFPPPAVKTAPAAAIAGATTVHTGEPWAGSTPFVLAAVAFGLSLIGLGAFRRRRTAGSTTV